MNDKPTPKDGDAEKRKRGGSQPGVRRGSYRERGTPPANPPKGDPHPKRKGPHHDDQYR